MVIPDGLLYLLVALIGGGIGLMAYFNVGSLKEKIDALKASASAFFGSLAGVLGHAWTGWGTLIVLAVNWNPAAILFWAGWAVCFVITLTNTLIYHEAVR